MALFQVPWPSDELAFSQSITLDGVTYTMTASWVEAPKFSDADDVNASWVWSLASPDGTVIESGMRLVAGTQYAWRSATGLEPKGTLALTTLGGTPLPDVPSLEQMQRREVVLVYDDPTL